MKLCLKKTDEHTLAPVDEKGLEWINKISKKDTLIADIVKPRNAKFFRKFFVLVEVAYDAWMPDETIDLPAKKDIDVFREELTIAAGHYEAVYLMDGGVKLKAKSISWAKMEQDEFERLYSSVINVVLQGVLSSYTKDDIDRVVEEVLRFG